MQYYLRHAKQTHAESEYDAYSPEYILTGRVM